MFYSLGHTNTQGLKITEKLGYFLCPANGQTFGSPIITFMLNALTLKESAFCLHCHCHCRTLRHKKPSVSVTSAFYRTGTLVLCLIPQSRGSRDHRLDLISTLINLFSMGSPTRSARPQLIQVNGSWIQCTCKPPHHINPLDLEIKIKILICHPYSFTT